MRVLVEIVVGLLAAGALGSAAGAALSLRRLAVRNRVDPSVRSTAPRTWLVSPTRAAVLHRRLRAASLLVLSTTTPPPGAGRRRRRRPEPGPLVRAGQEIVARAVALDRQLVAAATRSGPMRRRRMAEMGREVAQLQRAATRVAELSIDLRAHLEGAGATAGDLLEDRIDGYEAALTELGVTRRQAGH